MFAISALAGKVSRGLRFKPGVGVAPGDVETLPAAGADWRGMQLLLKGGSGTRDKLSACRKVAAGTYEWMEVPGRSDVEVLAAAAAAAATAAAMPVGSVVAWATNSAPTGWLLCDGSAVSQTTYAGLYAVLGTAYDTMGGASAPAAGTFRLPNLKGRVVVGRDGADTAFDALGETGGAKTVTLTAAESGVPAHTHPASTSVSSDGDHTHTYNDDNYNTTNNTSTGGGGDRVVAANPTTPSTGTGGAHTHPATTTVSSNTAAAASSAHNNLQPYGVLNYIIRAS